MSDLKQRAIFFDRDGTIIEDKGYLCDPGQVRILPGVVKALCEFKKNGWLLIIVSNQSGVGRGYFSLETLHTVQEYIQLQLKIKRIIFDGAYFCCHAPNDRCACRKPEPGLLFQASRDKDVNLAKSWMIGDKVSDMIAGQKAGCNSILLSKKVVPFNPFNPHQITIIQPNLLAAARYIMGVMG